MASFAGLWRLSLVFVTVAAWVLAVTPADAAGVLVITAEEFDAAQALDEEEEDDRAFPVPGSPTIIVERPDTSVDVTMPVELMVVFRAEPDARIDPDSLVVRYGPLNIAERLREHLEVSADGVSGIVQGVKPGKYRFRIYISDDKGRTGFAVLSFNAVES